MKLRMSITGALTFCALAILAAADPGDMVVHEWGTFLAMNGSDGVSLDGMYHEEHALPAFVHARSRDQLRLPSSMVKGETPVIYFYTSRRSRVQVAGRISQPVCGRSGTRRPPWSVPAGAGRVAAATAQRRISWNVEVVPPALGRCRRFRRRAPTRCGTTRARWTRRT